MILFMTNNEPFCLKYFMRNELTVSDLKVKIDENHEKKAHGDRYLENQREAKVGLTPSC